MRHPSFTIGCFVVVSCLFSCKNPSTHDAVQVVSSSDLLDETLQNLYQEKHIPGFAVAVFTKDTVIFEKGFGFADLDVKRQYTPNTKQMLASISKTFIGVSLMKSVGEGKIDLDAPINTYLSFEVKNPYHPDMPITVRQLAMHTSSINDSLEYNRSYLFETPLKKEDFDPAWHDLIARYNDNVELPMDAFLKNILWKQGPWYHEANFYPYEPGAYYAYSNLGASLLAQIIANVQAMPYEAYVEKEVFIPLQMGRTTWKRPAVASGDITRYYKEDLMPFPGYTLITAPDGGIYSTVSDLTKFLQEIMKGYQGNGTLLQPSAYATMLQSNLDTDSFPDALCWDLSVPCCIGHAGNDFGTSTLMYFEPKTGVGRILFANVSLDSEPQEAEFYDIFNALFEFDLRP